MIVNPGLPATYCTWFLTFHDANGLLLGHAVSRAKNAREAIADTRTRGVNPGGICSFRAVEDAADA